ncbi:hypothetical protein PR048_018826 [Dryococelus australis]|uniref:TTF-type domain-containing protein n=1 Tax=Dryococelus australis TaxID=614101 RepID=A0ABQ9H1Q7_9NEOP|nr:hypothetical protein PR048_018826 [Dryococelus australis]
MTRETGYPRENSSGKRTRFALVEGYNPEDILAASMQHDEYDITHDKPHQADRIPPNKEEERIRHLQYKWFRVYPWLDYNPSKNTVFCFTCIKALRMRLVQHNPQYNSNIIYDGFTRWKKAIGRFSQHKNSSMDKESTEKLILLQQTPVANQHKTLTNEIPEIQHFLKNKKNFASWGIQNEVINDMAHSILRGLLSEVRNKKEFSIIVDETRDESCKEQVSICIRTVNSQILEEEDVFLGLYDTSDIRGERLFAVIEHVLCHFKISAGNVMMAITTEKQPKTQYCHCANHSLKLILQDSVKKYISLLRDCMQWVQEIGNIVKCSPKIKTKLADLAADLDLRETHDPKPLAPHADQSDFIKEKYVYACEYVTSKALCLCDQFYKGEACEYVVSKALCLYNQFPKGEVFLGLRICLGLFSGTECLSVVLQKKTITAAGSSEAITVVSKCLREKRNEDGFNHLWSEMDSKEGLYFKALDSITGEIQRRFEPTGKRRYALLGKALATQLIEWNSKVTESLQEKYFDLQQLGHQIEMLKKLSPHCTKTMEYMQRSKDMHPETRYLFPELERFFCYLLVTPVTTATA